MKIQGIKATGAGNPGTFSQSVSLGLTGGGDLTLEDFYAPDTSTWAVNMNSASSKLDRLTVNGMRALQSVTAPVFELGGTITELIVDGLQVAAGVSGSMFQLKGTITVAKLSNLKLNGANTGSSAFIWINSGANIRKIYVNRLSVTQIPYLVYGGASTTISFTDSDLNGISTWLYATVASVALE